MMAACRILYFVVAVLALACILSTEANSEESRAKRAILSSKNNKRLVGAGQKTVKCTGIKFAETKRCCKANVGNFFQLSNIQGCSSESKLDSKLLSYTSYHVNNLFDKNNHLDLDSAKSFKDIQTVACITECLFRDQNLLTESGKINYTLAGEFLAKAAPDRYKAAGSPPTTEGPIMDLISVGCGAEIDGMNLGTIESKTGGTCSKDAMMFIQCVRRTILVYCPPSLVVSNPFCNRNIPLLKAECGLFNTTINFN